MDDPRTNFIPELEEDRFQSMAAVPVPSRSGDVLGVIVLHTAAPHEFDEGILNVLPADGVGHRRARSRTRSSTRSPSNASPT